MVMFRCLFPTNFQYTLLCRPVATRSSRILLKAKKMYKARQKEETTGLEKKQTTKLSNSKGCCCIVGAGNAAHVLAGILPGIYEDVRVFSDFQDEAKRFNAELSSCGGRLTVIDNEKLYQGKPSCVTKDPSTAMEGSKIFFLALPSFAHENALRTMRPFLSGGATLVVLACYGGFDLMAHSVLGDNLSRTVAVVGFETLPWAARIEHWGQKARILGTKKTVRYAASGESVHAQKDIKAIMRSLGVDLQGPSSFLGFGLSNTFHITILHGQFKDSVEKAYETSPLFYQGVSKSTATTLEMAAEEVMQVKKKLLSVSPKLKLDSVLSAQSYPDQIKDKNTLFSCLTTNAAYDGLTHPMKKVEGGFRLDVKARYFWEDMPFGLVVCRGVAELCEVRTPVIDGLIFWAQKVMGKSFLVMSDKGKATLCGSDLGITRAPQRFGIDTLEQLLEISEEA